MKHKLPSKIRAAVQQLIQRLNTPNRPAAISIFAAAVALVTVAVLILAILLSPAPYPDDQSKEMSETFSEGPDTMPSASSNITSPATTDARSNETNSSPSDGSAAHSSSIRESTDMTSHSSGETKSTTRFDESSTDSDINPTSSSVKPVQATYFVSPDGRDQPGNGGRTSPFGTIQYAIENVPANSMITLLAGIYTERLDFSGRKGLTVSGEGDGQTIISGKNFHSGYLIEISQAQNIHLKNVTISDFRGDDLECVLIRRGSSDVQITGCVFRDIGVINPSSNAHVILAKGDRPEPLRNILISGNTIYRCYTGSSESVTMESNVDGFEISRNLIYDVSNIAIDVTGFYANGVNNASLNQARNGRITNNTLSNVVSELDACAAIYVDGGRDILIENNHVSYSIYGIELGCENRFDEEQTTVPAQASGITVRHNTVYNCLKAGIIVGGYDTSTTGTVQNCDIYNNTLYKNRTELELSRCSGIRYSRNIVFGSGGDRYYLYHNTESAVSDLHINDNIYFTDSGTGRYKYMGNYASDLKQWQQVSGFDLDSRMLDPLFVAPDQADFRLKSSSEAIGYGA